ncbi:MAG: DAK2 domain-containing protein, partial [Caldilineae bacterium]
AAHIAERFARGAMMGARGNSGVILSQILRGFAQAAQGKETIAPEELARGLRNAAESAYRAVMKPVEGTILTVARAMAEGAEQALHEHTDIAQQLQRATETARAALLRTPEMLPILKEAGVVDSGGQGLVTILEGMVRRLRGESTEMDASTEPAPGPALSPEWQAHEEAHPPTLADGRYGYDIQYLVHGQDLDVNAIRAHISALGECPLVIGDSTMVKVHVHALSPGPALDYGASLGMLDDVVVENLDLQFAAFAGQEAPAPEPPTLTTEQVTGVGIVAVAAGEGLAQHFLDLGASTVVTGGQSMNPSTEELLQAVQALDAEGVILLPNNKNVLLAAQQVVELADKPVYVVPSRSAAQGFAAMMALDFNRPAEVNAQLMSEAIHHVVTVELTRAVRTTNLNGIDIHEGDVIGLLDGQLVAAGQTDQDVICRILDGIDLEEYEFVGVYYGGDVTEEEAAALVAVLEERHPDLEFELHPGGQPAYTYIFSIE